MQSGIVVRLSYERPIAGAAVGGRDLRLRAHAGGSLRRLPRIALRGSPTLATNASCGGGTHGDVSDPRAPRGRRYAVDFDPNRGTAPDFGLRSGNDSWPRRHGHRL